VTALDIISAVKRRVQSPDTLPIVSDVSLMLDLVIRLYAQALDYAPWSWLRADTTFQTNPPYSTGTVTGTAGSAILTGTGTGWSSALVGYALQLQSSSPGAPALYVASVQSATQLTLEAPLPYALSGAYQLVAPRYTLSQTPPIKNILHISNGQWKLREANLSNIRRVDPTTTSLAMPRFYYRYSPTQILVWPTPDQTYLHRVWYLQDITKPTTLDAALTWGTQTLGAGNPWFLLDLLEAEVYRLSFKSTGKQHFLMLYQAMEQQGKQALQEMDEQDSHNRWLPDDVRALPFADITVDVDLPFISGDELLRIAF
jgi:hypothetical protein